MQKNFTMKFLLLVLALFSLAAIGCGSVSGNSFTVAATPTPTPTPTPIGPVPTPTPISTPTPGPTATPTPFPTPTPGPSPTPTPFPTPTPGVTSTLVFVGSNVSGGITVFKMGADGSLTEVPGAGVTGNFQVSALALSGQTLIAAQGNDAGTTVQVNLYSVQLQTGVLSLRATAAITAPVLDARGTLSAAMNDEFLYIGTGNGVYAFSFAGGNLALVPGSPFQTGKTAFRLRVDGAFLMAAPGPNSSDAVQGFQIAGNGALMPHGVRQNSQTFNAASSGIGVAKDPGGRFLIGTFGDETGESVMAFKIDATTGAVTSLPGSHPVGATRPTDIVIASF